MHLHSQASTIESLAQTADRLHPAKHLLDLLADQLTERRADTERAARCDEVPSVVSNSPATRRPMSVLTGQRRITLGDDKGYDTWDVVVSCSALRITPHIAQNYARPVVRRSTRTVRHRGYALSQWISKQVEEAFG
jgi:hypothetical protein